MLSDSAEFCYKCTDFYHPGDEGGILWNDKDIAVKWPEVKESTDKVTGEKIYVMADGTPVSLSEKDKAQPTFSALK